LTAVGDFIIIYPSQAEIVPYPLGWHECDCLTKARCDAI
jgi:hypothetical protein